MNVEQLLPAVIRRGQALLRKLLARAVSCLNR